MPRIPIMKEKTEMTDEKKSTTLGGAIGSLALSFVLIPPVALLHAWAASVVWGWFMVPRFGADPTLEQWFGIRLLLDLLGLAYLARSSATHSLGVRLLNSVFTPLFLLAVGFLVKVVCGW